MTDAEILGLYERSVVAVHRAASRLCAGDRRLTEEIVQETYLALVRHLRSHPDETVGVGWLITTCRNRFLDQHRSNTRRHRRELAAGTVSESHTAPPVANETLALLAALPTQQRTALMLRYVDDLAVGEVARLLGRSVRATESLLARGRTALRSMTEEIA